MGPNSLKKSRNSKKKQKSVKSKKNKNSENPKKNKNSEKSKKNSENTDANSGITFLKTIAKVVTKLDFFSEILDEIIQDTLNKPIPCKKCFDTHFPWKKICIKQHSKTVNLENYQSEVTIPKLRGGALVPKYIETD